MTTSESYITIWNGECMASRSHADGERSRLQKALKGLPDSKNPDETIPVRKSSLENLVEIFDHKIRSRNKSMQYEALVEIRDYLQKLIDEGVGTQDDR